MKNPLSSLLWHAQEKLAPTKKETMTAIRNLVGVQNYVTPPQQALKRLVKHMMKKFQEPVKTSVDLIADLIKMAVEKSASQVSHSVS